jgi:FG-GAP-like repeat/FG-GAP repeat
MAALGALVITAPAHASFAPEGSPLAVGAAQPYGVLTADFNADGRTDVATVNGTGSNLSVFLRGPAGFATEAGSPFPVGAGPGYGAVADFNGDGLPDVATQNFSAGTVSIMLRQAGGGFAAGAQLSVGSTGSVTAADFNGDGRADIAAPSYNGNTVVTYLGNGSGGFTQEPPANATGATPRDIVAADFNRDGQPDLAITNLNGGSVTVLLRNAANNGFASEAAAIPVGASPEGIESADFNGDGYPDLAVAVLGTNTVNVLLRNPGGGFTAEAAIPVGAGVLGLATADLNADGRPDLAVTSNTAGTVTVLLRQAGGGFAADGAPLAAPGANGVAAGDFNGDGKPDLAASNDQANTLSVFLNTTTPAAPAPQPAGPPAPPVPGKSVVVRVVSGTVLIKYPAGKAPPGGSATAFAPLTGAANIPMGSVIDTTKGRVALTSAADTGGKKTQSADFYDGIFQVKQSVPKKKPKKPKALVTDLVMKGQTPRSQCAPLKGARSAAVDKKKGPKSVLGKLWGNGKGKFRTNGTYSSATVRGTIWLVEDRCEGTYTKVRRGVVAVRDFKRKKTVSVKAGHSYLARAQRAASKGRRG